MSPSQLAPLRGRPPPEWLRRCPRPSGLERPRPTARAGPITARTAPPTRLERRILEARRAHRRGADWIAAELGVAASTVGRVLRRHRMPLLRRPGRPHRPAGAPRAGEPGALRARAPGRAGPHRRQEARADPRGRRLARPRARLAPETARAIGYDYVHSAIDDHSRLAYSEIHPDERGETCAAFMARAAAFFARRGITRIERVMSDTRSGSVADAWWPRPGAGS